MPLKFMNAKGKGSTSDAIAAIQYAVKHGFKLVNCSFGSSSKSSALKDVIDYAQNKKVLLVVAPGDTILSTYLGGGYKNLSGTSMAAPYVAGVAAMLRKQESGATYGQLRKAIREKVDRPPALKGKVAYDGRLNAWKALKAIPGLVD